MRQLLREWSEARGAEIQEVGELPVQPQDRDAFDDLTAAGLGRVTLRIGDGGHLFEMQLEHTRSGCLLALRNAETEGRSLLFRQNTDRLYALAAVAEGLVHDLNNILGAAAGFSEHLASVARNPDERMFLESMREGTRTGAEFTKTLLRLLQQPQRDRCVVPVQDLVGQAVSLFRSSARLAGNEVRYKMRNERILVRAVPEDVVQCLLNMLLFSRASSPSGVPIDVHVEREDAGTGGLTRKYGRVVVRDRGDLADGKLMNKMLTEPTRDVLEVARRMSGNGRALLHSSLAMLRCGGMLRYDGGTRRGRSMSLLLPAARQQCP